MARKTNVLTALEVKKIGRPGYYADGGNLYLQVARGGSKSWVFRFALDGRTRDMGLGGCDTFSLAEARQRAKEARQLLADGIDPIENREEQKRQHRAAAALVRTFDQCAAAYIEAHEPSWSNAKHAQQWRNTLATYASPIIGHVPVDVIDKAHVLQVLQPIWLKKTETASRLRGRIERVLGYATSQGFRTGDNPARWADNLAFDLPAQKRSTRVRHHAALPYSELGAFMQQLRQQHNTASRALEFIILTAARTSEAFNATWEEIDLQARRWTIPAGRMKKRREHVVPLSDDAVMVLHTMIAEHGADGYVFPGRRRGALSNMAGLQLLKRMGRADLTVHGFRSTFRDWAGEVSSHPREVIEHALAHQLKDKAEAAYQRGDLLAKRVVLMSDWAAFCKQISITDNVVQMKRTV